VIDPREDQKQNAAGDTEKGHRAGAPIVDSPERKELVSVKDQSPVPNIYLGEVTDPETDRPAPYDGRLRELVRNDLPDVANGGTDGDSSDQPGEIQIDVAPEWR
jgi:hypothetical protein